MGSFEFFEHQADMGIRGVGESWEEAFSQGAKALFQLMTRVDEVKPQKEVKVKVSAKDLDALFVEWLNELLSLKDLKEMFFSKFEVKIKEEGSKFKLEGSAWGERMDLKRHEPKIEAKAATYSQLKSWKGDGKFYIQCIVDV